MRTVPFALCLLSLLTLSGCLSPVSLNRAVTGYDEAVTNATSRLLLINIARAHNQQPIHFTGVSNIAATFDFRFSAGGTPALTGNAGGMLMPVFGGSVAENPTISIVPIEGEEFTRRLLTPFQQSKLTLLLRQHFDIDMLLRLMVQEARVQQPAGQTLVYHNNPADHNDYEIFRRLVLHLSAIQDRTQLHAEPLMTEKTWTIPASAVTAEGFQALEKEFTLTWNRADNTYALNKQVPGPILITNYDPATLSAGERKQLENLITANQSDSDIAFDIRAGHFGGEWPLTGTFRLRSFHSIISFISRSINESPEYHVDKDPRTPPVTDNENPVSVMAIKVSDTMLPELPASVHSHGKYYAVNSTGPAARWNRNAFQLLYLLFQMTITETPRTGVPSITIAK